MSEKDTKTREEQILERIKDSLIQEGYVQKKIYHQSKDGIGSAKSYFDALIDLKLEGREYPSSQEVWEEMKSQINYLTGALLRASEDYAKLERKVRALEEDNKDLIKEK